MPKDNQINVRVNDRTDSAIEEFAEDKDYNKAEAVRRMIEGRLAGEGYLEGIAVSDGGSSIKDVENGLNEVQSRLNEIDNEREERSESFANIGYLLVLSLVWIMTELVFQPPSWVVISSGGLLVAGLLWQFYRFKGEVSA